MNNLYFFTIFLCCHLCAPVCANDALYESLDPTSISEHLAFFELYPDTPAGKKSLEYTWKLITKSKTNLHDDNLPPLSFPDSIDSFIQLIQPSEKKTADTNGKAKNFAISPEALQLLEMAASHLPNRSLKGYKVQTQEELLQLAPHEIDVASALFLLEFGTDETAKQKRGTYEAAIDLMAIQVLARAPMDTSCIQKIAAINELIFFEMGFRFPPHSTYSDSIDLFTFLPTVLEERRGVCLGVSTLYLAIAQRIGLPLEIVTPPGHIFLRYKDGLEEINIETTMRGVHIHSDEYLGINTKKLKTRTLREVVGMSYVNQASIYLSRANWQEACASYEKALAFMPDDPLVQELLGISLLFCGKEKTKGRKLLEKAAKQPSDDAVSPDILVSDILTGNVDIESVKPYFMHVDETRKSLEQKKEALLLSLKKYPKFRAALFQVAVLCLQLHQPKEAIAFLEKLHTLDSGDISCEFYLAALYHERYNEPKAVEHFAYAEKIAKKQSYYPKQLGEMKTLLSCSN